MIHGPLSGKKAGCPPHPVLFALHPVVALYASNVSLVPLAEVWSPALVSVAWVCVLWALAGFAPRITHCVDDYELLLRMVSEGLGVSFIPAVARALYPDTGAIFRVPAGYSLYMNVHYYNTSDDPVEGWSRLDVKLEPASPTRLAVGVLGTGDLSISAKANTTTELSYTCKTKDDMKIVMWSNHMHEYGTAARTTAKLPSGEMMVIKDDPIWRGEWATNPNFSHTPLDQPIALPAGTELTTRCSWNNTTNRDLGFPDEMCAFIAFHTDWVDHQCGPGQ